MRLMMVALAFAFVGCGSSSDGGTVSESDTGAPATDSATTGETSPSDSSGPTMDSEPVTDAPADSTAPPSSDAFVFSDATGQYYVAKAGAMPVKIAGIFSSVRVQLSPDGKRVLLVKDNSALGQTCITVATDGSSVMKELGLFNGNPIGWLDNDTVLWFDKGASTVKASKYDASSSRDVGKVKDSAVFRSTRYFLSGDKKQIAVSDWKGVYIMNADGTGTPQRFDVGEATAPVWMKSGKIVTSGSSARSNAWLTASTTDSAFKKTTLPFTIASAVTPWFPEDLVLVSAETTGMGGLRVQDFQTIKEDGSAPTKLAGITMLGSLPENIIPSRDGKKILFAKDKQVMTASIDGSGATPAHTSIAAIQTVDW